MISRIRNRLSWTKSKTPAGLRFDRPLVLFQSDDWGRVGVRDREGWEELCAAGLNLGEKPYDFYSLETADDLHALTQVLQAHSDSVGQKPSIVMNFILANVDFERWQIEEKQIPLRALDEGLPGKWNRPNLFDAYRQGIRERVFYPALHGLTHFCEPAMQRAFETQGTQNNERSELIEKLWTAQTPYIHWRMPWIGYEYWDPELVPSQRSLPLERQRSAIRGAAETFQKLFSSSAFSACAPGYRANADTAQAWFENGVRVAQNGRGEIRRPYLDERGMLFTFRTVEMEPAVEPCDLQTLMSQVNECFAHGVPAVISMHSINFHSTLKNFRGPTLELLHEFLGAMERRWPDLLYVNDADFFSIATSGAYDAESGKVSVRTVVEKVKT